MSRAPSPFLVVLMLGAACGGTSFQSGAPGSGGAAGQAAEAGAAGTSSGHGGAAGEASGGSAGEPSSAGAAGTGAGGSAAAGTGPGGGSSGGDGGSPGSSGAGGSGGSQAGGAGGSGGAPDCAQLKTDYNAAKEKARVCDSGSTDQCSASSTLPAVGCGCPTLVNSKSEYTALAKQKYQAIKDGKCDTGPVCGIACRPAAGALCSAQPATAGTAFVCTAVSGGVAP